VSAAEVDALEAHSRPTLKRFDKPSEPPAYSWVVMAGRPQPHWSGEAAMARLLALAAAVAAEGAALLGLVLGKREFTILNVWEPGCRGETAHDDERDRLTVLLRLRAVPRSGELSFEAADGWHAALGAEDNCLLMAPEVQHRVSASSGGAEARLTLVTLYRVSRPPGKRSAAEAGCSEEEP